ncbi:class I SAM-dependent DNA methyltransferase [Roseovarius phycicola]|uniref:Methyltransferase domain-containing protein n=1 Tax=Roseovarius phycicola TaxID=3080976 RepID=A0ABZ2HMA3_9RHOB
MSQDDETIRVYSAEADRYAKVFTPPENDPALMAFLESLSPNSALLDLGCGPGFAAAYMAKAGHSVTATDATPEMVEMAAAHPGVTAELATFDDISGTDIYDGIWANFCLLHAPRADLPKHLSALSKALKPRGLFHIGMKTGAGEKRDSIGRLYTYVTEDELRGLLRDAGLTSLDSHTGADPGLDGTVAPWVTMLARADA